MNTRIEYPAICEVQLVIRFLNAKNVRPAEIHRHIVEVYGEGAMKAGGVREWCRLFKEGRTMPDRTPPPIHTNYSNS
jgi:hypothetical protein